MNNKELDTFDRRVIPQSVMSNLGRQPLKIRSQKMNKTLVRFEDEYATMRWARESSLARDTSVRSKEIVIEERSSNM